MTDEVTTTDDDIHLLRTSAGAHFCTYDVASLDAYRWARVFSQVLPSITEKNMDTAMGAMPITPILVLNAAKNHELLYEFEDGSVAYDDGERLTVWDDADDLAFAYLDTLGHDSILLPWLCLKNVINLPQGFLSEVLEQMLGAVKPLIEMNKLNFKEPPWQRALPMT